MRFRVLLRGEGFVSRREEFGPVVDGRLAKFGFFTTRVVDAQDSKQAIELAITQAYDDRLGSSCVEGIGTIVPEQVHRVSWFFRRLRPPRGFTFFTIESEHDRRAS
jgi:hypothetical protein